MTRHRLYDDQLIVITGAAGFIGSAVVKYLNNKGFSNLILVDDFKRSEKWKNLRNKRFADFISRHELFEWLKGREREIEAFVHLGACSDTVETDGDYFMETNYRYSVKLADYALSHNHRFIYASSAATYGDGRLGFSDSHDLLDELTPLNLYGFSKHMFDLWLKQHGALDQVVGLKYFNVFGPNEWHKERMASMVYHLVPVIQKTGKAKLFKSTQPEKFADGDQCRDFIYVKDAVEITCSFLVNELTGIYNVGTGRASTWHELAAATFKALKKPIDIEYISMPVDLIKHYQNYTCADMSKYHSKFKEAHLVQVDYHDLDEAVIDYVHNHLVPCQRW